MRFVSLLLMSAFVLWAIWKARDPRTWEWLTGVEIPPAEVEHDDRSIVADDRPPPNRLPTLEQSYAGQALAYFTISPLPATTPARLAGDLLSARALWQVHEQMPLPDPIMQGGKSASRRAPTPVEAILEGALDREGFLVENPDAVIDDRKSRADADARYHLMQVAQAARPEDLAADAQSVRYAALLQAPAKHRGQVIHVEGELRKVAHFELHRDVPGLTHFYQGWITTGASARTYCVLFAELPSGFPPEAEWNRTVLPVQFDGYFLKVLKAEDPSRRNKAVYVPVLVGRTVRLPPQAPPSNLISIAGIVAGVFLVTVCVCGLALWLYRRGDRRVSDKMAELRERTKDTDLLGPPSPDVAGGPDWTANRED